jgi:hypothetical protein
VSAAVPEPRPDEDVIVVDGMATWSHYMSDETWWRHGPSNLIDTDKRRASVTIVSHESNRSKEPRRLVALSLGAGVQSTTLALLAVEGVLPKPDSAIFADTGWEPAAVYAHLDRLTAVLEPAGIPVYRVSKGNLRRDAIDPEHRYASVPYFVRNPDGSEGMGRRQCTSEYKLAPIRRKVRELLGAAAPDFRRVPKGNVCEQWVGFSTDEIERANRRNDSGGVSYLTTRYPLLDLGMSRKDCDRWLTARGWSTTKSACIGCPFHGNAQWRALRDDHPEEWADAVEFDAAIRNGGSHGMPLNGEAFLHRSRVPLALAPIDRVTRREWGDRQVDLLDLIAEEGDPDGCSPYGCRSGEPVVV